MQLNSFLKKHKAESIQFVDGWTGKGAIYKELRKEISSFEGVSDELAVLWIQHFLQNYVGRVEDIMIPSSCLNCTVSGLLSRTFLRNDIIKGETIFTEPHSTETLFQRTEHTSS